MVAEKRKNAVWTCEATCKGSHGERLVQLVCELARVLIISGQSMNIAVFSTRNLREQGRKSCEASHWANEQLVACECFLANYVNEGDSRKFSSVNDSQYTVCQKLHSNGFFRCAYYVTG